MKLLPVIVAVSKAQINLPDLSNFDLSAFGLGPGTPINFPDAGDEERYFFTTVAPPGPTVTVPTTTAAPIVGNSCWKCDQMTYATCASGGWYEECTLGDEDCCFVEVREKEQTLAQLCTGCKDYTACQDMKRDNFVGPYQNWQCRSDYRLQRVGRHGGQQSVCRQCFRTCDPSVTKATCFGSIDSVATTPNFMMTLDSDEASFEWKNHYLGGDFLAFGIPTHAKLDSAVDGTVIAAITAKSASPETRNIWFTNAADGKVDASDGLNGRDLIEMTYWGLQGAARAWWESDLKTIQDALAGQGVGVAYAASNFN